MYIFKSFSFLFIQIITIIFGIIYTFGGIINKKFGRDFVDVYLLVNTIDGVLFPVTSYFAYKMYKIICSKNDIDYSIFSPSYGETFSNISFCAFSSIIHKKDDKKGFYGGFIAMKCFAANYH